MRSVPAHFTRRKQNGKSKTLNAKYTPTADQPYSRDNFRSLPLRDSDSSPLAPPVCDLRDHDQLKFLLCILESRDFGGGGGFRGMLCVANRAAVDFAALLAECILLTVVGVGIVVFLQVCATSLWKGEVLEDVVLIALVDQGWRPRVDGRNARIMLCVPSLPQTRPKCVVVDKTEP